MTYDALTFSVNLVKLDGFPLTILYKQDHFVGTLRWSPMVVVPGVFDTLERVLNFFLGLWPYSYFSKLFCYHNLRFMLFIRSKTTKKQHIPKMLLYLQPYWYFYGPFLNYICLKLMRVQLRNMGSRLTNCTKISV